MMYKSVFSVLTTFLCCFVSLQVYSQVHDIGTHYWKPIPFNRIDSIPSHPVTGERIRQYNPAGIWKNGDDLYVCSKPKTGFQSGDPDTRIILKSSDGGSSWVIQPTKFETTKNAAASLHKSGANSYILGNLPNYVSTDNGVTWSKSTGDIVSDNVHFNSISFHDSIGILTLQYLFNVYCTSNAGKTWRKCHSHENDSSSYGLLFNAWVKNINEYFIMRYSPWTTTNYRTKLYHTTNTGQSWKLLPITINNTTGDSADNIIFTSMKFFDNQLGIATVINRFYVDSARYDEASLILRTTNGGMSWVSTDTLMYHDSLRSWGQIHFMSKDTIIVNSARGYSRCSYDQGRTWRWHVREPAGLYHKNKLFYYVIGGYITEYTSINEAYMISHNSLLVDSALSIFKLTKRDTTATSVEHVETALNNNPMNWIEDFAPHPASQEVSARVFIAGDIPLDAISFDVYNLLGVPVASHKGSNVSITNDPWGDGWKRVRLPLQGLPAGVYVFRYSFAGKTMARTFVLAP